MSIRFHHSKADGHRPRLSGQEEVSVVVRGSGHWRVERSEVPVRAGSFIRFDPR
jgi:hypothetical protein